MTLELRRASNRAEAREVFADVEKIGEERGEASCRAAEKFEMAKMMKSDNEPIDKIAKYTGLSVEDIERL